MAFWLPLLFGRLGRVVEIVWSASTVVVGVVLSRLSRSTRIQFMTGHWARKYLLPLPSQGLRSIGFHKFPTIVQHHNVMCVP